MAKPPAYPRARSSWTSKLVLFALVGVVTWVIVLGLGERTPHATSASTATAAVRLSPPPGRSAESLEQEIVAERFLQEALGLAPASLAAVRANLHVAVESSGPECRVTLSYTGREPATTLPVVNRLAEHLASVVRASAASLAPTSTGSSAVEAAQTQRRAAEVELDRFLAQYFAQLQQRAERLAQPVASTPLPSHITAEPAAAPTSETLVENPQWVELNNRIAQLEQDRAEMLQSRTAEHPGVRDLELQLTRLNQQLAGLARQIPASQIPAKQLPTGGTPPREPVAPPPASPAFDPHPLVAEDRAAAAHYLQLRQGVEQAEALVRQAIAAEPQRPQTAPAQPQVELASRCESLGPSSGDRLLWVALAAAVAMAAGVGMLSLGLADPPLGTVAEVEAALPLPVLGVIGVSATAARPVSSQFTRPLLLLLLLSGLALVLACIGVLAVSLRG